MANGKKTSWHLPFFVLAIVCVGILGFFIIQSWIKGRIPEPEILDITLAQEMQHSQRDTLRPQSDEPYHYDFFTLLEQPVPDRAVPDMELAQNPAIRAKARHSLHKLNGKFAVQVASVRNAGDARTLVHQLNAQGYHAVIYNENTKGADWYRVRIDGGIKREQAETLQAKIEKQTGLKGFVVTL